MSDELNYLDDEQVDFVKNLYPKSESSDDGKKEMSNVNQPEDDKQEEKKEIPEELKAKNQDWRDGYETYEKKTKQSERLVFKEEEIEVIEEDL